MTGKYYSNLQRLILAQNEKTEARKSFCSKLCTFCRSESRKLNYYIMLVKFRLTISMLQYLKI